MLGALLITILVMDLSVIYVTHNRLHTVLEQALDAAIVMGTEEEYLQVGQINIDPAKANLAAQKILKDNLKLDANMSNKALKIDAFILDVHQDPDDPSNRPFIETRVQFTVQAMTLKIFGKPGYPMTLTKSQFQLTSFK